LIDRLIIDIDYRNYSDYFITESCATIVNNKKIYNNKYYCKILDRCKHSYRVRFYYSGLCSH